MSVILVNYCRGEEMMKMFGMSLFGTATLLGLNMGFWLAMFVVIVIVILMNVIAWGMKPKKSIHRDDPI